MEKSVTERRLAFMDWYETEYSKTGWDNNGLHFENGDTVPEEWTVIEHLVSDKYYNPTVLLVEKETKYIK